MKGLGFGVLFLVGEIIEVYEVVDVVGNMIICIFIVIVNDIEVFVLICFVDIEVGIDFMKCLVLVEYVIFIVMDNCLEIFMI